MSTTTPFERLGLGRRLRLALIGGGPGSYIGETHRMAARLDDLYQVVAAAVSGDAAKAQWPTQALGLAPERCHADWGALIAAEAARPDGAEVVAVMTPNASHAEIALAAMRAGLHVIVDKPLATTLADARAVAAAARQHDSVVCLTHCYSAYPMVRRAREMVAAGALGTIRQVQLQYVQGHMARPGESRKPWKRDPAQAGGSMILIDIGTHTHHLGAYVTGLDVAQVLCDAGASIPGRQMHDTAHALLRYRGGARGNFWVTQAAAGSEHGLAFRIHGDLGGLIWQQETPNALQYWPRDGAQQTLSRRLDTGAALADAATRIAIGHPEGYIEAFANLYTDAAFAMAAKLSGQPCPPQHAAFPQADDGVKGAAFVEAAVASSLAGAWVDVPVAAA